MVPVVKNEKTYVGEECKGPSALKMFMADKGVTQVIGLLLPLRLTSADWFVPWGRTK